LGGPGSGAAYFSCHRGSSPINSFLIFVGSTGQWRKAPYLFWGACGQPGARIGDAMEVDLQKNGLHNFGEIAPYPSSRTAVTAGYIYEHRRDLSMK